MPIFICPNCGDRSVSTERTAGFQNRARGCKKCGFGFLFELLDDYYPAPNAAFFILDQQGRLIGTGRGARELTGLGDLDVIGRPVQEVLGLEFENGERPHRHRARVGRAGARQAVDRARRGRPPRAREGGHLPRLRRRRRAAPRAHAALIDRRPRTATSRSSALVAALLVLALLVIVPGTPLSKRHEARPRPEGRRRAGLRGPPDAAGAGGHAAGDRRRDRDDPQAHRRPRRLRARDPARGPRPDLDRPARRCRTPSAPSEQVGTTAQLQFYDWEPNVLRDRGPTSVRGRERRSTRRPRPPSKQKPQGARRTTSRRARGASRRERGRPAQQHRRATATTCSVPTSSRSGPDKQPVRAGRLRARPGPCKEMLVRLQEAAPAPANGVRQGHRVPAASSRRSAAGGPPSRLARDQGARGHRGRRGGALPRTSRRTIKRYYGARGRLGADGHRHQEPRGSDRPEHQRADRHDGVHRQGPRGVRAVTKRIAERGSKLDRCRPVRDKDAVTSASRSRSTTRSSRWRRSTPRATPRASTAAPARRSRTSAPSRTPRTSPRACASARCRSSSS